MGELEPMHNCVVKVHEASQMLVMVDCVGEMTLKQSCKSDEYGSFQHVLFMVF